MSFHQHALGALKRGLTRTFEHYRGRIQEVNRIRHERDQQMQSELDAFKASREKDPNYITVPPKRRQDVMNMGRRIIK